MREILDKLKETIQRLNGADLTSLTDVFPLLDALIQWSQAPSALKNQAQRLRQILEKAILGDIPMDSALSRARDGLRKLVSSAAQIAGEPGEALSGVSSVQSGDDDASLELLRRFVSVQQARLDDFEAYVLEWDKGNAAACAEIRRYLHTLKGEFGVLDLAEYAELIHVVEERFGAGTLAVESLLRLKDFLISHFSQMASGNPLGIREADYRHLGLTSWNPELILQRQPCPEPTVTQPQSFAPTKDPSFIADFIQESREHIHIVEVCLLELETNPASEDCLHAIFRACHTVKGLAGFLEFKDIQLLAHAVESLMDQARSGSIRLSPVLVDALLAAADLFKELLAVAERTLQGEPLRRPAQYEEVLKRLHAPESAGVTLPQAAPTERIGEILVQAGLVQPDKVEEALEKQKSGDRRRIGEILIADEKIPARAVGQALGAQVQARAQGALSQSTVQGIEESVRVPVSRLDQLIDAIGEAVIAQSMIGADPVIADLSRPVSVEARDALRRKVARAELIMRQIQELSMSLRMVSIKGVFQKMNRLVRDLSKKLGKSVELIVEGESTELDKTVVENIGDPLVHMVRNALDHGIESPEERRQAGKAPQARLWLRAYHKAGNVYIEVRDDGRGLNREKILAKAQTKGLVPAGANPPDSEVWKIIFEPGFSTAETVTDVSGRGVGMDVVRKNIEALRGSVEIHSEAGLGTTFSIRLPLTLAIIDGMVVRLGSERYIVPTLSVLTTVRPQNGQVSTVAARGEILDLRGELIRLIRLQNLFGHDSADVKSAAEGVVLVVEDSSGKKAGILVDEILDQQQVVIKNIGGGLRDIPGITGGAIMNDGTVSLILDIGALVRLGSAD